MFTKIIYKLAIPWLILMLASPVYAGTATTNWQGLMGNDVAQSGPLVEAGHFNPFLPPSTDAITLTGSIFQGKLGLSISNENLVIGDPATATDPTRPFFASSTGYSGMMTVTGFAHETGQVDAQGYPVLAANTDFKFTLTLTNSQGQLDFPSFNVPGYQHWNFYPGSTDFMPIGTVLHYSYDGVFSLFDAILQKKMGRIIGSLDMKIVSIHGDSMGLEVTDKPQNWIGFQRLFFELDKKGSPNHRGIADAAFVLPKNFAIGQLTAAPATKGNPQKLLGAFVDASPYDPEENLGGWGEWDDWDYWYDLEYEDTSGAYAEGFCPFCGNPINMVTGNKFETQLDYAGTGVFPVSFTRYYNSQSSINGALGVNWTHTYSANIRQLAATVVEAERPDQKAFTFRLSNGIWKPDPNVNARLEQMKDVNGQTTGWRYTTAKNNAETYDANGKLVSIANRVGLVQSLNYDVSGRLANVSNPFGRMLGFAYDAQNRIQTLTDPGSGNYTYTYDGQNNLASVTYPNGKTRAYSYENTAFPHALTGIIDENGARFATYTYDDQGRGLSSEHAGGADKVSLTYDVNNTGVTDARGTEQTYSYINILGVPRITQATRPGASGGSDASTATYDTNGNVTGRTDFNGVTTTYAYDLTRNLQVSRTEAAGTMVARTITTEYHPALRVPTQIAEPNRETALTYDDKGNRLQETITAGTQSQTQGFAYNGNGQIIQSDGPRTDVNDITINTYDAQGNLSTTTDPVGHTTKITEYDAHGKPLTTIDPTGLTTQLAYDPLGRVTTSNVGGEVTTIAYDAVGQPAKIILPDNSSIAIAYDEAHRPVQVEDQLGNKQVYTLDALGKPKQVEVRDSSDQVIQVQKYEYDALNRLTQSIGAQGEVTTYAYDDNGNRTSVTDPLGNTITQTYDALNRVVASVDNTGQTTQFQYDANDNLNAVIDPKGLVTEYAYDGLGNQTATSSPDTNTTQNRYDPAGNLLNNLEARGKQLSYSVDQNNNITQIRGAGSVPIDFTYDPNGRLVQLADDAGNTRWEYDLHGRVLKKTQQIGTFSLVTQYAYDTGGRLAAMTYPSGKIVRYTYTNGQLTQMDADTTPLLKDIQYQPFGPAKTWTWGNGAAYHRSYDSNGRLTQYDLGNRTRQLSYDDSGRITAYIDTTSAHSQQFSYDELARLTGFTATGLQETYEYDANGNRLSLIRSPAGAMETYTYESGSNKLLSIDTIAGSKKTYSYDSSGNTLSDGTNLFTYDGLGRLSQVSNPQGLTRYQLNGKGQRLAKLQGNPLDLTGDVDQDGQLTALDMRKIALMVQGKTPVDLSGDCNHDNKITLQDVSCVQAKMLDLRQHPEKYVQYATYFVYDEGGHLLGEYTQTGQAIQETVYMGDTPVAVLTNGNTFFVYADHLNVPRAIADSQGAVVWRWDSDPFGTTLPDEDPDGDGNKFTYNLRFPGQYYDQETGLNYNYYRYYEPASGRYIQPDPTGLNGGSNIYGYVNQDPLNQTDLLGQQGTSVHNKTVPQPPLPVISNPKAEAEIKATSTSAKWQQEKQSAFASVEAKEKEIIAKADNKLGSLYAETIITSVAYGTFGYSKAIQTGIKIGDIVSSAQKEIDALYDRYYEYVYRNEFSCH